MANDRIQEWFSPESLVRACAEGLLGELIKLSRMAFYDMQGELTLHHTIQLIAALRGYHHRHEYALEKQHGELGDNRRIDFVFYNQPSMMESECIVGVEVKVAGKRSKNAPSTKKKYHGKYHTGVNVEHDMRKLVLLRDELRYKGRQMKVQLFLMVINMYADSHIIWDEDKAGVSESQVRTLDRYEYSRGPISKSVSLFEMRE